MFKLLIAGLLALIMLGCSSNQASGAAGGAAIGAAGSAVVGVLVDLIVDGKVDAHRLARNATGGAIVGAAAGTAAGYEQDQREAAAAKQAAVAAEMQKYQEKIGQSNVYALTELIQCRHDAAYKYASQSAQFGNKDEKLAGFAIEALVDKDRGNQTGVSNAVNAYIKLDDHIKTKEKAYEELDKLYIKVLDERRAQGLSERC